MKTENIKLPSKTFNLARIGNMMGIIESPRKGRYDTKASFPF